MSVSIKIVPKINQITNIIDILCKIISRAVEVLSELQDYRDNVIFKIRFGGH